MCVKANRRARELARLTRLYHACAFRAAARSHHGARLSKCCLGDACLARWEPTNNSDLARLMALTFRFRQTGHTGKTRCRPQDHHKCGKSMADAEVDVRAGGTSLLICPPQSVGRSAKAQKTWPHLTSQKYCQVLCCSHDFKNLATRSTSERVQCYDIRVKFDELQLHTTTSRGPTGLNGAIATKTWGRPPLGSQNRTFVD
jgi:hypothetical protein